MQRKNPSFVFTYFIKALIGGGAIVGSFLMAYRLVRLLIPFTKKIKKPISRNEILRWADLTPEDELPTIQPGFVDPFTAALRTDQRNKALMKGIYEELDNKVEASLNKPRKQDEDVPPHLQKARAKVQLAKSKKKRAVLTATDNERQIKIANAKSNYEILSIRQFPMSLDTLPFEFYCQLSLRIIEGMPVKLRDYPNTGYFDRRFILLKKHPITKQQITDADLIEFPELKRQIDYFVKRCSTKNFDDYSPEHVRQMLISFLESWKRNKQEQAASNEVLSEAVPAKKNRVVLVEEVDVGEFNKYTGENLRADKKTKVSLRP